MNATRSALEQLGRPLRRSTRLLWLTGGVGLSLVVVGALTWLAKWGVIGSSLWVVWAWVLGGVGLAAAVVRTWVVLRRLNAERLAGTLEAEGGWRRGALTALLEPRIGGTSEGLLEAADRTHAIELGQRGPPALARELAGVKSRLRGAMLLGAVGVVSIVLADPIDGAASQLWAPGAALERYLAPIRLEPARTEVEQGESVTLALEALGRRDLILSTRIPGEGWDNRVVALDSVGRAEVVVGPLQADLLARALGGGRSSDTARIRVRMPAFLGQLDVEAEYPAYLGRDREPLPVSGERVLLPAGTTVRYSGEATAVLGSGRWVGPTGPLPASLDGPTFRGSFRPVTSGEYRLVLRTEDGDSLAGDPVQLPILVVPDSAPGVDIPSPGLDTAVVLERVVEIVVDARDDYGLRQLTVELHRRGSADSVARVRLPLPAGGADRAIVPARLLLDALGAAAGDTVAYWAWALDNAPEPQRGRSREYLLVLPTSREARSVRSEATEEIRSQLDSLISDSRALERQAEDLAQAQSRSAEKSGDPQAGTQLSFEEAKRAEAVARDQEQLLSEAESLEESLRELAEAAERAGIGDSAWEKRLAEIRDELRRALSPELRERLAELQKALEGLDRERAQQALEQLAEAQRQLREALERSRELFKRAALEGELASLEQEAKEIAERAEQNAQALANDSSAAGREETLAAQTDSLAMGLEQAAKRMEGDSGNQTMSAMAQQARAAANQMRAAGEASRAGQQREAQQQGEEAAGSMNQIQQGVQEEREAQQQAWREEVVRALDRALSEAGRLADRQLRLTEEMQRGRPAADLRREQASVQEGVQQLLEQMKQASGQNALVSPRIGTTLTAALQQMGRARAAIATARPNLREAGDQAGEAVDALNVAAYQMLRSRGDVANASSGSGMAEALERMAQLAQQQGALSQQAGGLLPMAGQSAIQQELQALAGQQRGTAQELERLRALGELSGLDQLATEAEDLARRLEAGRLDRETVARQERLFQRMLDAGRTLQGEEKDDKKERESETPGAIDPLLPSELDPRIRRNLRWPTWEELLQLPPDQRRLVAEYFRRLSTGKAPDR